eukprot:3569896-Rhodomonas_salina.1
MAFFSAGGFDNDDDDFDVFAGRRSGGGSELCGSCSQIYIDAGHDVTFAGGRGRLGATSVNENEGGESGDDAGGERPTSALKRVGSGVGKAASVLGSGVGKAASVVGSGVGKAASGLVRGLRCASRSGRDLLQSEKKSDVGGEGSLESEDASGSSVSGSGRDLLQGEKKGDVGGEGSLASEGESGSSVSGSSQSSSQPRKKKSGTRAARKKAKKWKESESQSESDSANEVYANLNADKPVQTKKERKDAYLAEKGILSKSEHTDPVFLRDEREKRKKAKKEAKRIATEKKWDKESATSCTDVSDVPKMTMKEKKKQKRNSSSSTDESDSGSSTRRGSTQNQKQLLETLQGRLNVMKKQQNKFQKQIDKIKEN